MQRALIVTGALLLLLGLAWPWLSKLGLWRLPGDINLQRDGLSFSFPIVSCLLISAIASLMLWLLRR